LLLFVFNLDVLVAVAEKKGGDGGEEEDGGGDKGIVRLTKTERRAKLKKSKKEAKKLGKQVENTEQVEATPQAAVLVFPPPPVSLSLYIVYCGLLYYM
jgi:hypothetical protein